MNNVIVVERATNLVQTEIDYEIIAIDLNKGTCFGFNTTAAAIWSIIEQPRTINQIAVLLTEKFNIELNEAEAAVGRLVTDLLERKLVRTRF